MLSGNLSYDGDRHYRSYVTNPDPKFAAPAAHKGRPQFLKKCIAYASKRDVTAYAAFYALLHLRGRRYLNEHRRRAINAMTQAMLHYVNLTTWQVEAPVVTLTRQCGLATRGPSGVESISRGSRLICQLIDLGFLEGEKVWDKSAGTWLPKIVHVTPLFWESIGIGADAAVKEQTVRFEKMKAFNLSRDDAGRMTINDFQQLRKMRSIQRSFEIRRNIIRSKQQIKQARRIAALSLDQQRLSCTKIVIAKLTTQSPHALFELKKKPGAFDQMVTREMRRMQALATDPIPPDMH